MQLLIDVADVHAYRERCQLWSKNRLTHLINSTIIDPQTGTLDRAKSQWALETFDAANPYPTIIPANV